MRRRQFAAFDHADRVGEETQPPFRGDRRVELAQRAGRAVARIRQRLLAMLARVLVERLEILAQHDHFAAHFQHLGPALAAQVQRDRAHGAQVGGHVLAGLAVAAGGALHEHAMLVAQADRQAIEFRFDRKHRFASVPVVCSMRRSNSATSRKRSRSRLAILLERIAQRQHRHRVAHFGKAALRPRADLAGRRIGRCQRRVLGFQRLQLAHQAVVLGVGDVRVVEYVIAVVGLFDLRPQRGGAGDSFGRGRAFGHAGLLGSPAQFNDTGKRCELSGGNAPPLPAGR